MKKSALGSRLRLNPAHLFDCFCEIAAPGPSDGSGAAGKPWVLQKYPENYSSDEVLKSVPDFVFPCEFDKAVVQHWSFVLTNVDSKWTFGFCRHSGGGGGAGADTALVILSCLPWHEAFFSILNEIAALLFSGQTSALYQFLKSLHSLPIPDPGKQLTVHLPELRNGVFTAPCPDHFSLPKIPENKNLIEYINAVDHGCMIEIFAAMLRERRIIIVSKKLSRLSACVQAANGLIAPMNWQHIFIPILPLKLVEYLSAPMPFLIGVPAPIFAKVRRNEVGDAVILHADENRVETPFKDAEGLPHDVSSALKRSLSNQPSIIGDGVSRSFLRALVALIGGYRYALRRREGASISFDPEMFVKTRAPSMQSYLREMLCSQILQQFIDERLDMMNSGQGFSDEFELEAALHGVASESKTAHTAALNKLVGSVRKEGGNLIKSVKTKANPAMKNAVRSVREKGKSVKHKSQSAVRDIKSKLGGEKDSSGHRRSAPSSPNTFRSSMMGSFDFSKSVSLVDNRKPSSGGSLSSTSEVDGMTSEPNGAANGAVEGGGLLLYLGGSDESPSLSSSSSSVDLQPPPRDSFDLLSDLAEAFDQRLSAKSSGSGGADAGVDLGDPFEVTPDSMRSSKSAGDLLSSGVTDASGDFPLGHPNPLYNMHFPEEPKAHEASGPPPPVPARKRLSFDAHGTGKPPMPLPPLGPTMSVGAEIPVRPRRLFETASTSFAPVQQQSFSSPFSPPGVSPTGPSLAAPLMASALPPPLLPVPSVTPPNAPSSVASRKAFFDSLLDDGAIANEPGMGSPKTSWTTFE